MSINTLILGLASITVLGVACPQSLDGAVVSVFSSRAAWESAVTSFTTEDFDALPTGSQLGSPSQIGQLVLEFPSIAFGSPRILASGPINGSPALELVVGIDGHPMFGDLPEYNRFILPHFATSFGSDFSSASSAGRLLISIPGALIDLATYLPSPGNGFFGFISDTAFDTVTITGQSQWIGNPGEIYEIDNVSFNAAASPVPEPSTYIVLVLGLALTAVRLRSS